MTFTEIKTEIKDRLGYTSTASDTRVGRLINKIYREVGTSIGLSFSRQTSTSEVVTIGQANVTFSETEKVLSVWILSSSSNPILLDEVLLPELRGVIIPTSDSPTRWALVSTTSNGVVIRLDASPETAYTLYADVIAEVADLSGSLEPAFPESFHDILIEGVLKDEYRKLEKVALARDSANEFQRRLSDLRMFVAKSNYMDIQQGKLSEQSSERSGGGTASQAVIGPASSTDNAIVRFNGTGGTVIQDSGITIADGASGTLAGSNSGDITLTGTPDYITISGQVITRGEIQNDDIRDSAALTVVGRSANSAGDVADIAASAASDAVLRESGSVLGFGTIATAGIANDAVSFAKMQNIATNSLIGRDTAATGDPETILLDDTLEMDGAGNLQRAALTGDVTASAGGNATTIANDAVTYAKMQNVSAASRILGRGSAGGSGDVEELTIGSGLSLSGTALSASATGSGLEQTFRGLYLRTSPNADVAATTITVIKLDQWVADDGTVVDESAPPSNNTAVISSSGAGGLDTGAEAASTWYEIYRIRKSSDGTLNTMLHRAKDYFLDESQTTTDSQRQARIAAGTRAKIAQVFDTDVTGYVEISDLNLNKKGSPTGRMWCELIATSGGVPDGAVLATSDKLDVSLLSTSAQAVRFVFRSPVSLTAATSYSLVFTGDWTENDANGVEWKSNTAGGYAAGGIYQYNGAAWSEIAAGEDFWFKVYVTENDASVTMPTGYDQKCKIGYVYNDSGSNFDPFRQDGHDVWNHALQAVTTALTATIPTLTDISAFIPPGPIRITLSGADGTAAENMRVGPVPDGYLTTTDMNAGGLVLLATQPATASIPYPLPQFPTEMQGIYARVSGGTGSIWVNGYRW